MVSHLQGLVLRARRRRPLRLRLRLLPRGPRTRHPVPRRPPRRNPSRTSSPNVQQRMTSKIFNRTIKPVLEITKKTSWEDRGSISASEWPWSLRGTCTTAISKFRTSWNWNGMQRWKGNDGQPKPSRRKKVHSTKLRRVGCLYCLASYE